MRQPATALISILLLVILVIGAYFVVTHWGGQTVIVQVPPSSSTGSTQPTTPTPSTSNGEPYRATLTGRYLCLPHVNPNGPQTLECALGMQTDSGTYFALDFNSASQNPPTLATGDRFTATGIVTPAERLNTDQWRKYPIVGIFSIEGAIQKVTPIPAPTSATLRASIGQEVTGLSVTLTPLEVVDDSRCPKNANCIWAGTVHVRTRVKNPSGTTDIVFELGKSVALNDVNIALTQVAPDKTTAAIATSSYQFTYEVTKK